MKNVIPAEFIELQQIFHNSKKIVVFENSVKGYMDETSIFCDSIHMVVYSRFTTDLTIYFSSTIRWKYGNETIEFFLDEGQTEEMMETVKSVLKDLETLKKQQITNTFFL